ncbi:hypothetical protein AB4Y81_03025 [Paenarthrobacter sp. TAF1]|uniref:hypothetical protein n=1 Tax=Paenarthrobacter sp. TAF1 TaxID=3233067 RepID=UPI003F99411F
MLIEIPQTAVRRLTDAAGDVFEIRAYGGQIDVLMNDEHKIEILVGDLPTLFQAMTDAAQEAE